jgi:tight adherence protein B
VTAGPADRAVALRELATLLRAGLTLRESLEAWVTRAPESLTPELQRLCRRLWLGAPVEEALSELAPALGHEAAAVNAVVTVHLRLGGDAARLLDDAAGAAEERRGAVEAAAASVAGARLSGRLVACLPFALLLLSPAARSPFFDVIGVVLLVAGIGLGALGLVWMSRIVPRPEEVGDPCAFLAGLVAAVCEAGASPSTALEVLASCPGVPQAEQLSRAGRLTALGVSWPEALCRTGDEGLGALAAVIERATGSGSPVAAGLRRLPVLMVLPLTLCVLPSFALLGLGPFLRGVSL